MTTPQPKDLRVWWIRNIPNKPQYWPLATIDGGLALLLELAAKDLQNPSVQSNAGGIQIYAEENHDDEPSFAWFDLPTDPCDRMALQLELAELELSVSDRMLDLYFGEEK